MTPLGSWQLLYVAIVQRTKSDTEAMPFGNDGNEALDAVLRDSWPHI